MQPWDARPTADLPGTVRGKTACRRRRPVTSRAVVFQPLAAAAGAARGITPDMAQRGLEGLRTRLARERERAILAAATADAACERSKKLVAASQRLCDESRRAKLERGR